MVDYGITRGGTITGPVTISASAPAGGLLHLVNTASAPTDHTMIIEGVNGSDRAFGMLATGDGQDRHNMTIAGQHQWGSGTGGLDTNLYRPSANALESDDTLVMPAGYVELATSPTFTLAAQTATPLAATVTASSTYVLTASAIVANAAGTTTVSWTGPAGATMQWNDTTTSTDYVATLGGTNAYAASASTRMALFTGLLKISTTAGTLTMTLGVSAGTTTLSAGSFLRLVRVA